MTEPITRAADVEALGQLANRLRARSLRLVSQARSSHIGSCLSVADIMAVLYGHILRLPQDDWENRDRLVVSKGHAAAVVYAALAEVGLLTEEDLGTYGHDGSKLFGHVTSGVYPGLEASTGSLGHGLPIATGMALVGKRSRQPWRVFCVMSDGELDEGSNWEALLFAGHHRLDNLVAVVDYNHIQSLGPVADTIALEPLADKFRAFGWSTVEVDGHDIGELQSTLSHIPNEAGLPTALIATTIKGRGVSFMENTVLWHYRSPAGEELEAALREVEGRV